VSATVEKIARIRVATTSEGVVLMMDGLAEDVRIVNDVPADLARQLCLDLIAAGYGPTQRGGRA
jgi:hypothetical protein